MDGANRKIELQSPEDLTYLINNVRRAAAEHLGAAFPPVEGADDVEEDELRVRIERLVNDYITQTFTLAAPNLSINGFDLDAKTFPAVYLSDPTTTNSAAANTRSSTQSRHEIIQYEPFDARKRTRLEELAREEEDLMREVASLKRSVPGAAARSYAEGFWEGVRADEAGFEGAKTRAAVVGGGEEEEEDGDGKKEKKEKEKKKKTLLLEGLGEVERVDDVEKGYAGVVETLGRLKREMPATVAKMERARVAGEYVVTEK